MNILISGQDMSYGNVLMWLPAINHLKSQGHDVYCNNRVLKELDIAPYIGSVKPDTVYVVNANRKRFWKIRVKYPFAKFYGFTWGLGDKKYSFGYTKAIDFDYTLHEQVNISRIIPNRERFALPRLSAPEGYLGITTSKKYEKRYKYWGSLIQELHTLMNGKIKVFGDLDQLPYYVETPSIYDFRCELETCSLVVACEGFGMHLSSALGIPMIVLWGFANYIKNRPFYFHTPLFGYEIPTYRIIEEVKKQRKLWDF